MIAAPQLAARTGVEPGRPAADCVTDPLRDEIAPMTHLIPFTERSFPPIAASSVDLVEPVLLRYVHCGRNAWHSTWIRQYDSRCMHANEGSATQYAEQSRTRGSVFYIKELPAICLRSAAGCIVVTQLNTSVPLSGYSPAAVAPVRPGAMLIAGALDNYITKGAPMLGAALSFSPGSRFWRTAPTDAVVLFAIADAHGEFEPLPRRPLTIRTSYSNGGSYRLGWTARESNTTVAAVEEIASAYVP